MAERRNAKCHCGAVAFTVELTDGLNTAQLFFLSNARRGGRLCAAVGDYGDQR